MSNISSSSSADLLESSLDRDPIQQFKVWFEDAIRANVIHPNAMTLATASADGHPSARVVLMKSVDERGFVFVTNYESQKGRDIAANPRAALVFHWAGMGRQVRVEGTIEKVSSAESDQLFAARPRDNQLSSAASNQSAVTTRGELDRRYEELRKQYEGGPVPRPAFWGGYRVRPERIEFWQHRFARMNDRVVYVRRGQQEWEMQRLAP